MEDILHENLQNLVDYLQRAIPEVKDLSDEFYRGANRENWQKFELMLEGLQWLQWLAEVCSGVRERKDLSNSDQYREIVIKMYGKLGELGEALEKLDQVLIGDLIVYEILPVLEELDFQAKISLSFGESQNVN